MTTLPIPSVSVELHDVSSACVRLATNAHFRNGGYHVIHEFALPPTVYQPNTVTCVRYSLRILQHPTQHCGYVYTNDLSVRVSHEWHTEHVPPTFVELQLICGTREPVLAHCFVGVVPRTPIQSTCVRVTPAETRATLLDELMHDENDDDEEDDEDDEDADEDDADEDVDDADEDADEDVDDADEDDANEDDADEDDADEDDNTELGGFGVTGFQPNGVMFPTQGEGDEKTDDVDDIDDATFEQVMRETLEQPEPDTTPENAAAKSPIPCATITATTEPPATVVVNTHSLP